MSQGEVDNGLTPSSPEWGRLGRRPRDRVWHREAPQRPCSTASLETCHVVALVLPGLAQTQLHRLGRDDVRSQSSRRAMRLEGAAMNTDAVAGPDGPSYVGGMPTDASVDLYAGTGQAGPGDLAALVMEVNRRAGIALHLVEVAAHGDSGGAAYVQWPDGSDGVITRTPTPVDRMRQTADVLSEVRSLGLPVPRHDRVVELTDGTVAIVHERLPGAPPSRVDADVIDAMVATNERFAGLLGGRPDVPVAPLHLRNSGPLYPRHDVLEHHNDRSRRLLNRIHEIGAGEPHEMTDDDLVHPDYTFGNILYDRGQVSGVVDWNCGAGRGDRRFALAWIRGASD